ncbi:alpha/beta fold hydrolase [Lacisediminihabitans changchengi]|uniref:Alpha/beta fold hydrolase n=1 Tax=Lacisediminihabitans changchengi TaxID=2787634 RepID=A0A934SPH1_9MICO|nr:alpha/beta fold hydrolase [Lacisediminihabitans changchengi]MBK4348822.1 alpha/beta fold hydrolase [Lacisediminihabitans changchengi]
MTPDDGTAGGPVPLVLIHGIGDDRSVWDDIVAELGASERIITYDLRGHGTSPTRPLVSSIWDFVGDLIAMLDAKQLPMVDLAGFSLGGLIAQGAAIRHPDRVRRLVVIGAVAARTPEEELAVGQRLRAVEKLGPAGVAEQSIARWFAPDYLAAHPEAAAEVIERMESLDRDAYIASYRVLAATDFADELAKITAPTLAIAGEDDIGSPPHMAETIASATGGVSVILPGVKHNILQEAAHRTAKEIQLHVN